MPAIPWYIKICIFLLSFSIIRCEDFGSFWHISDIHVDRDYSIFGNKENLCHEEGTSRDNKRNISTGNGLYGNILCDTPWLLLNLTVTSMYSIRKSADFIIWTGDNLPHSKKIHAEWGEIYETLKNMTLLFRSMFDGIPILPSIGNHDTFPPNTLPIDDSSFDIYRGYLEQGGWKELLHNTDTSTFEKGGYYSMLVKEKLRIISLNTVLWHLQNELTAKQDDPANQFQWLEGVLQNSTANSEKVYIIGHISPGHTVRVPPGKRGSLMYHSQHLESYLKIIFNYTSIIAGQFYGHLHLDMFQIFRDKSGDLKGSSLLAPAVTPWYEGEGQNVSLPVNPSIRLVYYSRDDFELLDYSQYILNLTAANSEKKEGNKIYERLYTFTSFYGVEDLTTKSLAKFLSRLKRNSFLFDEFFRLLTAGMETVDCDKSCRVAQICAITGITPYLYDICWNEADKNFAAKQLSGPRNSIIIFICVSIVPVIILLLVIGCILYRKLRSSQNKTD